MTMTCYRSLAGRNNRRRRGSGEYLASIAFAIALFPITKAAVVFVAQDMRRSDIPRIIFAILLAP